MRIQEYILREQLLFIFSDYIKEKDRDPLTAHLLKQFQEHPKTEFKTSEVVFDYKSYSVSDDFQLEKFR